MQVPELIGGASALGWVALKAVLIFAVAVIGLRLAEWRTFAQLSAFDFEVAVAIGAIIGLLLARGKGISAGTVVAFTTLQTRLYFPIGQLLQVSVELRSSLALFDRVFEYLDVVPDIVDAPGAVDLPATDGGGRVALREICAGVRRLGRRNCLLVRR
jgi:ABC-type multidrug transport system fused ATPase/permease subunit